MLRVVTLNLWHDASPNYGRRAHLIRTWLALLDPDIITFQEALLAADAETEATAAQTAATRRAKHAANGPDAICEGGLFGSDVSREDGAAATAAERRAPKAGFGDDKHAYRQRVTDPSVVHQARDLAPPGYYVSYAPACRFWRDERFYFGNAVASRYPFVRERALDLAHADDGERRVALCVDIASPHGIIRCATTHLNWRPDASALRERQVLQIMQWLRDVPKAPDLPLILTGDMNCEPHSAAIRFLTGQQSLGPHGRSEFLVDCFGNGGGGATYQGSRNHYAALEAEPDRRLDYVFVELPREDTAGQLIESRVVLDEHDGTGVWPSDHYGLMVDLRTEPAPEMQRLRQLSLWTHAGSSPAAP